MKIVKEYEDGSRKIVANFVVNKTNREYFSITGTTFYCKNLDEAEEEYNKIWKMDTTGCIHDDIIEHVEELRQFIPLHLSDIDGVPMHAVENGWYYLRKAKAGVKGVGLMFPDTSERVKYTEVLADHLRIGYATAEEMVEKAKINEAGKIMFANAVSKMMPRWKREAERAIKFINQHQ